jgi:hypothetical protein
MTPPRTTPGNVARARNPFVSLARRVAVGGALALALFAVGAPTASAGQSQNIDTRGGFVSFNHVDEFLYVDDERGEGYSVVAELKLRNGAIPIARVTDGDGANGNPNSDDLSLREGTDLSLRMCYEDRLPTGAAIVISCSRWQNAEA